MPQFPTRLALVPLLLALAPAPASLKLDGARSLAATARISVQGGYEGTAASRVAARLLIRQLRTD